VDEVEQVIVYLPMKSAATPAASRITPGCYDRLNDASHRFVEMMLKHSCPKFSVSAARANLARPEVAPLCRHVEDRCWPTTAILAMQRIELLSELFNHCTALRRRDRWEEIQQQFPELALKCSRGMGRESVS
jgi:hypothetical protein